MLYEDFLLTVGSVSTKLCLELVWHVRANVNWGADLKIGDAQVRSDEDQSDKLTTALLAHDSYPSSQPLLRFASLIADGQNASAG